MQADNRKLRVIVIDDHLGIQRDFQKILVPHRAEKKDSSLLDLFCDPSESAPAAEPQELCVDLACASQGEEGLELAKSASADNNPFLLAFVDMRMPPGWDGAETIERIKAVCPSLHCVICTAHSDIDEAELRARLGGNLTIIRKPFHPDQITSIVRSIAADAQER